MEEQPCSWGFLQDRTCWRVADPHGGRQGLCPRPVSAPLCPVAQWYRVASACTRRDRLAEAKLQAAPPSTHHKVPAKPGAIICFPSVYNTQPQICLSSPFLFIVPDPEHQTSASASSPRREGHLPWSGLLDPTLIETTLPAASANGQHLSPP